MTFWACLQTKPQCERRAEDWIKRAGFTTMLPMLRERDRIGPLFPRYLFVQIIDCWYDLRWLPGVSKILLNIEGVPAHVPEQEIEGLEKLMREGVVDLPPAPQWYVGQELEMRDLNHMLAGKTLIFQGMRSKDRVKVLLHWLGSDRVVDLPIVDLQPRKALAGKFKSR